MSFNWRLLLAPERVLEYVVWHEVCHLEVLDHSPRFWALLERHWPGYREERDWLRRTARRWCSEPHPLSSAARSARSRRSRAPV